MLKETRNMLNAGNVSLTRHAQTRTQALMSELNDDDRRFLQSIELTLDLMQGEINPHSLTQDELAQVYIVAMHITHEEQECAQDGVLDISCEQVEKLRRHTLFFYPSHTRNN
jgi:hypothetical protein